MWCANQADNRLITATGTSDALNGEANLTWDGTTLLANKGSGVGYIASKGGTSGGDYGIVQVQSGSTVRGRLVSDAAVDAFRIDTAGGASTPIIFHTGTSYSEKLRITSGGVLTFPTAGIGLHNSSTNSYFFAHGSNETRLYHAANNQIKLSFRGSGDTLRGAISADANGMHILTAGSLEQKGVRCVTDGTTELYNNGIKKLDTVSTGIRVHGDEGGTAQLQLLADQGDDNPDYWRFIAETDGTLNMQDYGSGNWYNNIRLTGNTGGVELYHNNSKKLETASGGVTVTGTVAATSYTGDGSSLTGISVGISTEAYVVQAVSGITTFLDLSKDDHKITASGITTIDVRGGTEASSHMLRIENSGITTVGFSTYFLFPSGGTPALPTSDGAISLISFTIHRAGAVGLATQLLAGASVNFS